MESAKKALALETLNKKTQNFAQLTFTKNQLSEIFRCSRSIISEMEKDGLLEGIEFKNGAATKKEYDWNAVKALAKKYREKVLAPKNKKVKVFANLKGGVGKSTISSQVAMTASASGLKTLIIDLDPQAHASKNVGVKVSNTYKTMEHVFIDKEPINSVIQEITPLLSIIPANLGLSMLELKLFNERKREEKLMAILDDIRDDWDLIIIDTNPSASTTNINAILAADELCVITATDFLSVDGLTNLFSVVEGLGKDFGFSPAVRIVPNLFEHREGISQESIGFLRSTYPNQITNTVVRKNVDIKVAQRDQKAIWQHNKKSTGSEDIRDLTRELLTEVV